jgi:hypothetical protein
MANRFPNGERPLRKNYVLRPPRTELPDRVPSETGCKSSAHHRAGRITQRREDAKNGHKFRVPVRDESSPAVRASDVPTHGRIAENVSTIERPKISRAAPRRTEHWNPRASNAPTESRFELQQAPTKERPRTVGLGRRTEGFYDTALNEASDARTTEDCTKASPRRQTRKVCRRPSVKTMLHGTEHQ